MTENECEKIREAARWIRSARSMVPPMSQPARELLLALHELSEVCNISEKE